MCIFAALHLETWKPNTMGLCKSPLTAAQRQFMAKMFPHDVESYSSRNPSCIWKVLFKETNILTIHGTEDEVALM